MREWLAGTGPMPSETRNYVHAITGSTVEQWAKGGDKGSETADRKQQGGPDCGILMATLKRAPNPFVAALEQRIVAGAMQPWGVIVGADISRPRMLSKYADLQQRHAAVLAGRDPILLDRGRVLLRYQVRPGRGGFSLSLHRLLDLHPAVLLQPFLGVGAGVRNAGDVLPLVLHFAVHRCEGAFVSDSKTPDEWRGGLSHPRTSA